MFGLSTRAMILISRRNPPRTLLDFGGFVNRFHFVVIPLVTLLVGGATAVAQPAAPATTASQPAPDAGTPPAPVAVDEAKVRELVQREVATLMQEREAKDAAERAAKEAAAKEAAPAAKPGESSHITGASGFGDVRLNLTLTNENVLVAPGETIPSVPGWRFGTPNSLGIMFFDNYDTRFSGYETLSHMILYRNFRKDHLQVEGAFVMRINEISERRIDLSDAGSYMVASWWKDTAHKDPTRFSLTAFPVSADRFRLGYSYRLSWGGNEEYRRSSRSVPGLKVQYDTKNAYAFAGMKSNVALNSRTAEEESSLAFLAGAGVDLNETFRLELNGGYFDRGNNELKDVDAETVQLFGGSLQLAAHKGMPVSSSIDYKLYKNEGERVGQLFKRAVYPGGLTWLAMTEFTVLGQTLKDPEKTGSTKVQWGKAGDVNVRVMYERFRFRLDAQYRDLAFILHSVPSLPTYSDFPKAYTISPNLFAAVGVDHNWHNRYTLGFVAGIEQPATLKSPNGVPGSGVSGESTAVIRNNGQQTIINVLPTGEGAVPQVALKMSGQMDFGEIYAALIDVYYSFDGNTTRLTRNGAEDLFQYEFGQFNQLGFNLTLQARF